MVYFSDFIQEYINRGLDTIYITKLGESDALPISNRKRSEDAVPGAAPRALTALARASDSSFKVVDLRKSATTATEARWLMARGGFFDTHEVELEGLGDCFHSFELHPAAMSLDFESLLERSRENKATVRSLLEGDASFWEKVSLFERNLHHNLEMLFVESIIADRGIARGWKRRGQIRNIEDGLERFVAAWEIMQPFYSVEGFVGSFGKEGGSKESGILDVLEGLLPGVNPSTQKGKQIALCIASVVGRDFEDVVHAIGVLKHIKGEKRVDDDMVLKLAKELRNTELTANGEVASFFNSLIRFHNWTSLRLKSGDKLGDTFDSVCVPAKALEAILGNKEISGIKDATSPKGIAVARHIEKNCDEEFVKERTVNAKRLKEELAAEVAESLEEFVIMTPEDPFFPHTLVGGKAQGLKSLKEAIEVLDLSLTVPRFVVISRIGLENPSMLAKKLGAMDLEWVGIARSSGIGEDSHSNLAGVFESVEVARKRDIDLAIDRIKQSFVSGEAKRIKRHARVPEGALGGIVLQERVEGEGVVLFLIDKDDATLSIADSPMHAVNGDGKEFRGSLDSVLGKAGLEGIREDMLKLLDTFGPMDLELVKNESVHVVQMRRIAKAPHILEFPETAGRVEVQSVNELPVLLRDKKVVRVNESLNSDRESILNFILDNIQSIIGLESFDNETSHIANLIMGVGIPFRKIG